MDTMNIFAARHKISTGRKFLKKFSSEKSLTGSSVDNPVVENGIVVSRSFYKKGYFRNQTWFSCGIPARIKKTKFGYENTLFYKNLVFLWHTGAHQQKTQ